MNFFKDTSNFSNDTAESLTPSHHFDFLVHHLKHVAQHHVSPSKGIPESWTMKRLFDTMRTLQKSFHSPNTETCCMLLMILTTNCLLSQLLDAKVSKLLTAVCTLNRKSVLPVSAAVLNHGVPLRNWLSWPFYTLVKLQVETMEPFEPQIRSSDEPSVACI